MTATRIRVKDWWARWVSDRAAVRMAWEAFDRFYGIPYLREITPAELRGMTVLERRGEIRRDEGLTGEVHWHRRTKGR